MKFVVYIVCCSIPSGGYIWVFLCFTGSENSTLCTQLYPLPSAKISEKIFLLAVPRNISLPAMKNYLVSFICLVLVPYSLAVDLTISEEG